MRKRILFLILMIFALSAASAAAQDFHKSRPFPLGNLLAGIQQRAGNLIYISEEDWDVNAFVIGRNITVLNSETFKRANPKLMFETVEDFDLETFFARLENNDYHWTILRNYLEANLTQIHIFKAGNVRRDIYAVGLFEGHIAGVRMFGVET